MLFLFNFILITYFSFSDFVRDFLRLEVQAKNKEWNTSCLLFCGYLIADLLCSYQFHMFINDFIRADVILSYLYYFFL
jgi:hypothetical protein